MIDRAEAGDKMINSSLSGVSFMFSDMLMALALQSTDTEFFKSIATDI